MMKKNIRNIWRKVMDKNRFIIQAVLSLNTGNTGYSTDRVKIALGQADQLEKAGVLDKVECEKLITKKKKGE